MKGGQLSASVMAAAIAASWFLLLFETKETDAGTDSAPEHAAEWVRLEQIVPTDDDGLPDAWEGQIADASPFDAFRTPADVHPHDDFDGDGRTNLEEFQRGTDPTGPGYVDLDQDGYPDVKEPGQLLDPTRKDNPAVGLRVQFFSR